MRECCVLLYGVGHIPTCGVIAGCLCCSDSLRRSNLTTVNLTGTDLDHVILFIGSIAQVVCVVLIP